VIIEVSIEEFAQLITRVFTAVFVEPVAVAFSHTIADC